MTSPPNPVRRFGGWLRRHPSHISALFGLTILWVLFGDDVSVANFLLGAVVALTALIIFPLPDVRFGGRLRPAGAVRFLLRFCADLVHASVDVARLAILPGPAPRGAVVAVQLHTRSEFHLTVTAITLSLTPGSLIVDTGRETSTLYVHVLDVRDLAGVEAFRTNVLELELRILRAIGSNDDLERATHDMSLRARPDGSPGEVH